MKDTTNNKNAQTDNQSEAVVFGDLRINEDLKHSILIVSLVANLFVLTSWVAIQVTTQFDAQVVSFLFSR